MRLLFFLSRTVIGDCNTFSFGLINHLAATGTYDIEVVSFGRHPDWYPLAVPVSQIESITPTLERQQYDFAFISNAHMIPMVLPHLHTGHAVFLCQGYESYYYGTTLEALRGDCPVFDRIKALPLPIIATSHSVQQLILEKIDRPVYRLPNAIDKDIFNAHKPVSLSSDGPKRILLVGNYLAPHKGILDGCRAIEQLSEQMDVQAVLITPEDRQRNLFAPFNISLEIHTKPSRATLGEIYRSCDVYCSSAWYEGLGLNGLEAMACGIPVVSTRNFGVEEYGQDGHNLLLAEPNNPADLARQLHRVLTDVELSQTLVRNGHTTLERHYDWPETTRTFGELLSRIAQEPPPAKVSPDEMEGLIRQIEAEGYFTPYPVYRQMKTIEERLTAIAAEVESSQCVSEPVVEKIQDLQALLKPLLANPKTQYYDAAKSKADYCRMFLSFKDDPRFLGSIKHLLSKKMSLGFAEAQLPGV